jgi:DNA-binding transcriptional MocR family regulator
VGGFYIWVTLPPWIDTRALLAAAVERLVAYVPGTAFYPDGRGANQMRLAFCHPTEDRIREGIERLGALLQDEERLYRSLHP